jgi:hypothetical protein
MIQESICVLKYLILNAHFVQENVDGICTTITLGDGLLLMKLETEKSKN